MNRYLENSWFRSALLLGAFAVGGMLTQVVPTYEEIAALRERPATPSAASEPRVHTSGGVTGIDVDQRHLRFVQRIA